MIKRLVKLPIRLVLHLYFFAQKFPPFWYLINKEGYKVFKKEPPFLNEVQKRILRDLRKNGVALAHIDELFPEENYLKVLQTKFQEFQKQAEVKGVKKFLRYVWDNIPVLDFNDTGLNPFLGFAFDRRVLDVVNSYIGVCARFIHFTLNITAVVKDGDVPVQSQRWHRDPEDKRMCKAFIYLNDVDRNTGPFVYLCKSHCGGKYWRAFRQRPPVGNYPPLGAVENRFPDEDIKVCEGRAGTVIFCDTAGLHYGGLAAEKERVMFTASYCSDACPSSLLYTLPSNFEAQKNNLKSLTAQFAVKTRVSLVSNFLYEAYKNIMAW